MSDSTKVVSEKTGMPPGTLIHVGEIHDTVTRVSVIDYSKDTIDERQVGDIEEIQKYNNDDTVSWVTIEGLANVTIIERIGKMFGIHQLVLEDILNTHQRPKFEEYEDYLFIVLKCLVSKHEEFALAYEQISIVAFKNTVFMFKEKKDDLFLPVHKRLRTSKGRFRAMAADFLMYTILDTIVDQNFVLIDSLDEAVTSLEVKLLANEPNQEVLKTIQRLSREVVHIRRFVSPVRELMSEMLRSETGLIQDQTRLYLRDVSDHAIRVIELVESYRELLTGYLDIYISSVSNKTNDVMKVLTVFASIFIPLTFLTGIYGMNFQYMPELKWHWAYPLLWVLFVVVPVLLLVYFKRKKWL